MLGQVAGLDMGLGEEGSTLDREPVRASVWAGSVAAALGAGWTVRARAAEGDDAEGDDEEGDDEEAYLVSPEGVELRVRTAGQGRPGRVVVGTALRTLDRYVPSGPRAPAAPWITLSPSRKPDDAAAEIQTRLLPYARLIWSEALAGKRESDAATARQVILAERLANALGLHDDARDEDFVNANAVRFWWGSRLYEFRLPGVNIELHSLSPDRAVELAEIIAQWIASDT
jgi:hypothetical protein